MSHLEAFARLGRPLPLLAAAALAAVFVSSAPVTPAAATLPRAESGPTGSGPRSDPRPGPRSGPRPGPASDQAITLAFGGDVHFEGHVANLLRHPDTALAPLRPYLAPADIAMVNLETAITHRGTPQPKQYRFRAPASALTTLASAGVDVVTMANNHAADYGAVGMADTLAARRHAPLRVVGIGTSATDAYAPATFTVRGRRVAVLGASQLLDITLRQFGATSTRPGIAGARPIDRLLTAVRSARARADVVVVYLHWGNERDTCPGGDQRDAARALVAAGADVVVGSHAHVVQGSGWLGRAFVAYGLGNFVWYSRGAEATTSTGVLTLTVVGRQVTGARWAPLRVSASGIPTAPSPAVGKRILTAFEQARACSGLAARPPAPPTPS